MNSLVRLSLLEICAKALVAAALGIAIGGGTARGAFTTVINSPPDSLDALRTVGIPSNSQLNLFEGADPYGFYSLWAYYPVRTTDNVEINLEGATVEGLQTSGWSPNTNVVINVRSGTVRDAIYVDNGNSLNVSGGTIATYLNHGINLIEGSRATISGGTIFGTVSVEGASHVAISGGTIGDSRYYFDDGYVYLSSGSTATMTGGTIRGHMSLDGGSTATITGGVIGAGYYNGGLFVEGASQATISGGSVGTLGLYDTSVVSLVGGEFALNGTPIAGLGAPGSSVPIALGERDVLSGTLADGTPVVLFDQGYYGDPIVGGTLRLVSAPVPAATPATIELPGASAPYGVRAGQRLTVNEGGSLPANFRASWGSTISITGGAVGERMRAAGATIDISGGTVGELSAVLAGSVVTQSGGKIGSNFNVGAGGTFTMTGGTVDWLFEALPGSNVRIAGGVMEPIFNAHEGSHVTIAGSGFRLNGVPVSGLGTVGATKQVEIPAGFVLSGTFADGRQFAFADGTSDYFAAGTLTLEAAAAPPPGPAVIRVPSDAVPRGLRTGQVLQLSAGGEVGENFNADWGSVVTMDGGRLGHGFEAVGALVNISGGTVGSFNTFYGTVANISGGTFEGYVQVNRGSVMNISGGEMTYIVSIANGGIINLSGGSIVDFGYLNMSEGATLNMSGGRIGDTLTVYDSSLNVSGGQVASRTSITTNSRASISGGTFGDEMYVGGGSRLLITGGDFRLDGTPIALEMYQQSAFDIPKGTVLSGTLEDGTPFAFSDLEGDRFDAGSVRLALSYYPLPAPPTVELPSGPAPVGVRDGGMLTLGPGKRVGDNFNAGWGSAVTVAGGDVGANFEAVGSRVLISGGSVGPNFDAFTGSVVTISGGTIGDNFEAHRGSTVNVVGGEFEWGLLAREGSIINILGGKIDGRVVLTPESSVHLFGTEFTFDGAPIPGLTPGQTVTFDLTGRGYVNYGLRGLLADGTPWRTALTSDDYRPLEGPLRVTLTMLTTADFDGDLNVTAADLAKWITSFGSGPGGDSDRDGDSDGADFLAWQRQAGRRAGPGAVADPSPVPEPTGWGMLGVALVAMAIGRRGFASRERLALL